MPNQKPPGKWLGLLASDGRERDGGGRPGGLGANRSDGGGCLGGAGVRRCMTTGRLGVVLLCGLHSFWMTSLPTARALPLQRLRRGGERRLFQCFVEESLSDCGSAPTAAIRRAMIGGCSSGGRSSSSV